MFDETTPKPQPREFPLSIHIEIKSENDVTEEDLAQFSHLEAAETTKFASVKHRRGSAEWNEIGERAYVHTYALKELEKGLKKKERISIIFAKNDKGDLVGYSIAFLDLEKSDPEKVKGSFIGVRSDSQHQGIGSTLLQTTHNEFLSLGITEYKTSVREQLVRLYDKLGINYEGTPLPKTDAKGMNLVVHLK